MGLLKKCQTLYAELRDVSDRLSGVEDELSNDEISMQYREELYKYEFELALQMSGCFEDLMYCLDKLEKEEDGMRFYATRIRRNAAELIKVENIDVDQNV